MDKSQGVQHFFSSFGLKACDENSVLDGLGFPYLTYNVVLDNLNNPVAVNMSLWYRGSSWADISKKTDEISKKIIYDNILKIDDGFIWFKRGTPWAQRMGDPSDDMIKRMYFNVTIEYLTAY